MVLQRQIVDVPVGAGVDELTGTQQLNPGKWVLAENARIVDAKTAEQRPGYAAMTTNLMGGGSISAARRLLRCGDETLIDDGNALYTYVRDDDTWRTVDLVCEVGIDKRIPGERGGPARVSPCDATWCSGMFVHAWTGQPNTITKQRAHARITDELTGARLAETDWECLLASQIRCIAVPGTTRVYVFYTNSQVEGTRWLVCRWVDINTPQTWSAEIQIVALALLTPWDVQARDSTGFVACYTPPAMNCQAGEIDLAGALVDTEPASFAGTSVCSVSYDASGSRVYMTYGAADPNGLRVASFTRGPLALAWDNQGDADIYTAGSPMTRCCGQTNVAGIGARVVYSINANSSRPAQTRSLTVNNAGVVVADTATYHVQSIGVPRFIGTRLYVVAYVASTTAIGGASLNTIATGQHNAVLMEVIQGGGPARPVARLAWGQAEVGLIQSMAIGLNPCTVGYVTAVVLLSENLSVAATPAIQNEGFDLYTLDWTPAASALGVEQDGELVMSGAMPTVYNGDCVSEYGFNYYPSVYAFDSGVGVGPPAGTYGYAVCFVHRDGRGVMHRSAPGSASIATDGTHGISIFATQYCLTAFQDSLDSTYPVEVELYRTVLNGTVYFHIESQIVTTTSHTYTFTDTNTITDALLVARRALYTTGDVMENVSPPAMRHVIAHNNRLWGISCDDVDRIWLSKLQSLREAQGFNETLTYRVTGAELVGLGSIDGKLLAFGKRGIWVVFGSGPSDTNQGNDLSEPQPVSAEHGCVDARSICSFPGGVTFQGLDGLLYVVNPGMQVQPVSLPVSDTLHAYPTINSVCYVPDDHELRVLASSATNSVVLVWNVLHDQWYVWKLKNAAGTTAPAAVSAALMSWSGSPDRFGVLLSSGVVLRESDWLDPDATYPTVTLKTGPLALQSVTGYQRLWSVEVLFEHLLAASHSAVTLRVYKDHATTTTWSAAWSGVDTGQAVSTPRLQLLARCPAAHQKCESSAAYITWTPVGGQNLRLQGLSLQLGVKAGRPRILPAAARK
jgi:hypothetical protein